MFLFLGIECIQLIFKEVMSVRLFYFLFVYLSNSIYSVKRITESPGLFWPLT